MRILVLLLSALVLTGCGFHPRARLQLPETLKPVTVRTADPYSPLGLELSASLERAGIAGPAVAGAPTAILNITAENWHTSPLTVDQQAQVREYITRYRVQFSLVDATGVVVVPAQTIELSREFIYDNTASAGSPAEEELLQRELRRDMQGAILRRLDVVLRPKN